MRSVVRSMLLVTLLAGCGGDKECVPCSTSTDGGADAAPPDSAPPDSAPPDSAPPDALMPDSSACNAGLNLCGKECVNLKRDPAHCGACDAACKAGTVCSAGACKLTCQTGLTDCKGMCVNLKTDLVNCGGCANTCKAGQVCSAGTCALSCQAGLTSCTGTCVNLKSDLYNCGYCQVTCKAGQVCSTGKCAAWCATGLTDCSGSCVDVKTDEGNCGTCGTQCKQGEVCSGGVCAASCGNGKVDPGEQCDGAQLWGKTCTVLGYYGGTLSCAKSCSFDISGCHRCGDGKLNGSEKCDGALLGGKTCKSQGYAGGNLACDNACALVTSGCGKCDDKKHNGDETGVDCGGSCGGCALGGACKVTADCKAGLCKASVCALAKSCADLHTAAPKLVSGTYTIDPNGGSSTDAFEVWCDMSTSGGGWTLVMSSSHTTKWACGGSVWHDSTVDSYTVTPTKEGKSRAYTALAGTSLLFKTHKEAPGRWAVFKMPQSYTLLQLVGTTNIQARSSGYKASLTKVAVGSAAHACWNQTWRVTWKNYWSSDNYPDSSIFAPSGAQGGRPCGGAKSYATGIGVRTDTNNGFSGYGGSFEGYGSDGAGNKAASGGYVSIYIK